LPAVLELLNAVAPELILLIVALPAVLVESNEVDVEPLGAEAPLFVICAFPPVAVSLKYSNPVLLLVMVELPAVLVLTKPVTPEAVLVMTALAAVLTWPKFPPHSPIDADYSFVRASALSWLCCSGFSLQQPAKSGVFGPLRNENRDRSTREQSATRTKRRRLPVLRHLWFFKEKEFGTSRLIG
jgi:hypothetical protein